MSDIPNKGNGRASSGDGAEDFFTAARRRMVDEQIRKRGIKDSLVIAAMEKVPRHLFVLPQDLGIAYEDHPLSIGMDQTISQPYIVAVMTEALHLGPDHRVLEIGAGSGYQTAILGEIVKAVYSIELIQQLAAPAQQRLKALGYTHVRLKVADGYDGWREEAPFDAILVAAAPEELPGRLVSQLVDGGRMVIPIGGRFQELFLIEKKGEDVKQTKLASVRFVPLVRGD